MSDPFPLVISSEDPILSKLSFKPYRVKAERRVVPFLPGPGEPQTLEIPTPWGETLTARKGDFLLSEVTSPNDYWPVDPMIFEESYVIIRPGYTVKKSVTQLVPMTDITRDPDRHVTVVSLEGSITVQAGDFFLARGVKGEIWPIPKNKVASIMVPIE